MQEILTNQEIENLDLSKVAALQQKRTLAFVNHFVVTTVKFLNTFSRTCERKLMQFEEKLEKVNAAMILLETRLSSIPEVNDTSQANTSGESLDNSQIKSEEQAEVSAKQANGDTQVKLQEADGSNPNDCGQFKPEYERFIKMIQVGVPLQAVKLKISLEGLDPNELDSMLKK